VTGDRWDRTPNLQQFVDSHLGRSHRIFHGEHDIIGISTNWLTKARFLLLAGTGSGRSDFARGMNMLVMYGIRQGTQLAFSKIAGSKFRCPQSSRKISAPPHSDIGLATKSPTRSGCSA